MPYARLLVALLLGWSLLGAVPAGAWDADAGRAWRGDATLRPGCHPYRFHYRIHPGHDDWSLELFLRGPGGKGLGTVVKDSALDRTRARGRFRVCRYTTRPGRFRIRGKLSVYPPDDGNPLTHPEEPVERWIKPARFRLR